MELTRWLPTQTMRLCLCAASTMEKPSSTSVRHRLFAVDVFAGGDSVFEDVAVLMVHGGDQDGVYIFAIKDRAVVAGRRDAGILDGFLRGDVTAVIEVAHGDALYAGHAERRLEVFASANAGADGSEAHGVAGRNRASGRQRAGEAAGCS